MALLVDYDLQYDFWDDNSELGQLKRELKAVKDENTRVRKGLFARHGELAKLYLEISKRCDIMQNQIDMLTKNR